jgi:23S rRNA (guanosine2251-2'-O)-methyltransferase
MPHKPQIFQDEQTNFPQRTTSHHRLRFATSVKGYPTMPRRQRSKPSRRPGEARANRHADSAGSGLDAIVRMSEEEMLRLVDGDQDKGGDALFLVLDGIQDPHNLGACLRSAEGAGVKAVIVPRHQSCRVTETVVRIACGAAARIPVVAVANLARTLEQLSELLVHVVGTSDRANENLYQADLNRPLALVLGAEEAGIRRLTAERCQQLVHIPMAGEVECLNVSAAAAVCLFEAVRQRSPG